jgi:DNA topoisomerase-1
MRTDSVNLSNLALGTSKEAIINTYGERYHKFRKYQTKSKGAQEAHEAIRPTYMNAPEISGSVQEKRLYDLIFKRTIACQMADAELERTTVTISIGGKTDEKFVAQGEVITFDGFLHVYMESTDEDAENSEENGLLPPVNVKDILSMKKIIATERFTQRPPRYTEASLVRRLEELGIGRPSTYAPTIQTIQNREYVERGDKPGIERQYNILTLEKGKIKDSDKKELTGFDRNKLIPTDTGAVVNDFLTEYFPDILDYNFTANVEKEFDTIAEGKLDWSKATHEFYTVFHPTVEAASAARTERKIGERELGTDPKSGKPVFVKIGRYGPLAQIGKPDPEDKKIKPQFASLHKDQSIETITLEEALKLFDLPRTVGEFEGEEMIVSRGRFGPFIRHNGMFASIPESLDPMTITEEQATELVKAKRQTEIEKHIKSFDEEPELKVLKGRYGPYIVYKGNNYRLAKTTDPNALTLADCMKIVGDPANNTSSSAKKKFTRKTKK